MSLWLVHASWHQLPRSYPDPNPAVHFSRPCWVHELHDLKANICLGNPEALQCFHDVWEEVSKQVSLDEVHHYAVGLDHLQLWPLFLLFYLTWVSLATLVPRLCLLQHTVEPALCRGNCWPGGIPVFISQFPLAPGSQAGGKQERDDIPGVSQISLVQSESVSHCFAPPSYKRCSSHAPSPVYNDKCTKGNS